MIYVDIPILLLKKCGTKIQKFIYPSSTNINYNKNSIYSKMKKEAEHKLQKFSNTFVHRFDKLYSKNTISFQNYKVYNLQKYLNQNTNLLKSILIE